MQLTQTDKLDILSHISGHPENEGMEPLTEGPRFPYSAVRDRIAGYAPPAPRNYSPAYDSEESPDISEDEDNETLEAMLSAFCISKQGRELSGDILPSMRTRGAIRSELASMGCAWES